jgi:hypothetical protein
VNSIFPPILNHGLRHVFQYACVSSPYGTVSSLSIFGIPSPEIIMVNLPLFMRLTLGMILICQYHLVTSKRLLLLFPLKHNTPRPSERSIRFRARNCRCFNEWRRRGDESGGLHCWGIRDK